MDFDSKKRVPLVARLSPREKQVLVALASGRLRKQIADDLGISIHTVNRYLSNTYRVLGVYNNVTATRVAVSARVVRSGKRLSDRKTGDRS
ncbi:MAG TPA: LuxR C-terminal-related transcriptional regulator [Verrucomicrobiae bacterium]|nr:LuxR C-terminal-related transcriptional regulator [Verrucomicrobiae bacterium]